MKFNTTKKSLSKKWNIIMSFDSHANMIHD